MAHFARLADNVVVAVHVIDNCNCNDLEFPASEPIGIEYLTAIHGPKIWKQCSYNNNFRGHYPALNDVYDPDLDIFVSAKPEHLQSFVFNTLTGYWEPPVPYPTDGRLYTWDEEHQQWTLATLPGQ